MAFTDVICPLLQEDMAGVVGRNYAALNRQQTGMLDALRSPLNTEGLMPIPIDLGDGKRKRVQVYYVPATPAAQVVSTPAAHCSSQTKQEPEEVLVEIDDYRGSVGRVLTTAELQTLCTPGLDRDRLRQTMLLQDIRAINVAVNQAALTFLVANFGSHFAANSPATVNVNLFNNNLPDTFGFSSVLEEYSDIEGVNRPLVVGAGLSSQFFRSMSWGCCNDGGIDLSVANGEAYFFRDKDANTILGANQFAVMSPGVMHLLQWKANSGIFMETGDTFAHTRIMDPITGLEYDVDIVYDPCTKQWTWAVGMHFSFFIMPDQWPAGSDMEGVNGTLRFTATATP